MGRCPIPVMGRLATAMKKHGVPISQDITYPFAQDKSGQVVHIKDHSKGASAFCLGCDHEMVARQGKQRQWHFAHKPPEPTNCDGEGALHKTAKLFVEQGFKRAKAINRPYLFGWTCPQCGTLQEANITRWSEAVGWTRLVGQWRG